MVTVPLGEQLISVFGVVGGMVQVPTRPEAVHAAVPTAPLFELQKLVTFFESAVERPVYSTHWPALGMLQTSEMAAVSQLLVVLVPPQAAKIESSAPMKSRMIPPIQPAAQVPRGLRATRGSSFRFKPRASRLTRLAISWYGGAHG